jgi:transposase
MVINRPAGLPVHIDRTLTILELVTEQIAEADAELKGLMASDPIGERLMTVPGVGPVTAANFRGLIDDPYRFKSAHAVESYVGLTPGERSSGEKTNRLGITYAGSARARAALVQAAWAAWRSRPEDPMVKWARAVAERRPKQVAIVGLARKMAGILFALWRSGQSYNPTYKQ